jgi:hypothetical protein
MMTVPESLYNSALIDELLAVFRHELGADFDAYRNHCQRVYNFGCVLAGEISDAHDKLAVAAVFHDLGIWTARTFDYIPPSRQLARRYLEKSGRTAWADEIEAMIGEHHKLTKYTEHPEWLVEIFRKADWIDVSRGLIRFKVPDHFVVNVIYGIPNLGYHKRLAELAVQRLKSHPFSPLPMLKM